MSPQQYNNDARIQMRRSDEDPDGEYNTEARIQTRRTDEDPDEE
jgi:hypothetical protein